MDLNDVMDKPFLQHYENLDNQQLSNNIESKKITINNSNKSMHIRYRQLFNLKYNDILYKYMIDDSSRMIITRWRLSSHKLSIETGRYKIPYIERSERKCIICNVLEDEDHALFSCNAHTSVRINFKVILDNYSTTDQLLNPKNAKDIINIAKYIREIEKNMELLKMTK